ncbi:MAG: DAK2 domain-containing protein [Chloroflexi bacterium]|nr:DAK2 domain-containing protein [Chloroflexota bacterium]
MERDNPQLQIAPGEPDKVPTASLNGSTSHALLDNTPRIDGSCTGANLREALFASARWLEQHTEAINALNVFPVPDGDTGTNMSRTMEAAVKELETSTKPEDTAEHISKRLAYGALMGARGNSGVILSQIIRGLADGLHGKNTFEAADLAHALTKAREMAYRAVIKPVEGTMLTVVREAAEAAEAAAKEKNNLLFVLDRAVDAARESVAKSPTLLPALRDAGVVDAGGHGCFVMLEGALKFLRGEELVKHGLSEVEKARPKFNPEADDGHGHEDAFGYCTNFIMYAAAPINFDEVRDTLVGMGQSAVIVGDETMVKVHIHSEDPGKIISYATSLGSLGQIKLDNMQTQHEEAFLSRSKNGEKAEHAFDEMEQADLAEDEPHAAPPANVSVIAVVAGEGLSQAFKNFGANYVVQGGQTMNPSTQDLLKAVNKVPSDSVIILPNNKNIVMVAQQIAALTEKKVKVVPTATIPQGITALSRFNYEASLDDNAANMQAAMADVRTGEVTRAVRTAMVNGISVTEGQWIGLLDDELSVAVESKEETVWQLLEKMDTAGHDLVTFYYGQDVSEPEAQTMLAQVQEKYPAQSVELVQGGQPHYHYIISVE